MEACLTCRNLVQTRVYVLKTPAARSQDYASWDLGRQFISLVRLPLRLHRRHPTAQESAAHVMAARRSAVC